MKILLAVDGSPCSEAAAREVARRPWPEGSEVKVISVAEVFRPPPEPSALPPHYYEEMETAARQRACAIAERAATTLRESQSQRLPVTTKAILDSPKDAIIEEAESWGADLIVVGSHGYRGYERFLLGSVSQAVASQARCSVEIVRCRQASEVELA
jgi:nucleotide-binding universal stress UspA family protein